MKLSRGDLHCNVLYCIMEAFGITGIIRWARLREGKGRREGQLNKGAASVGFLANVLQFELLFSLSLRFPQLLLLTRRSFISEHER